MKITARKMLGPAVALLMLGLSAPVALAQQPAPKTSSPAAQPQASQPAKGADVHARVSETAVDASIPSDPRVDQMVAVYSPKVRELDVVVGKLKGELRKGGTGAGSLGNFVTDGMRQQAAVKTGRPITLALMNAGGMRRSTIGEGELRARDIFELLPFENALVTIDLTGAQLLRLMQTIVAKREAQSGARLVYKTNADKSNSLVSAQIRDGQPATEKDIDPNATYTIVTIDYLYRVGGSTYGMLQEGKNMKELGITLRDALMNYVRAETAAGRDIKPNLDGRFVFDRAGSAAPEEVRP